MSFSRELHLWLQSLDLSLPIKQPRRDFSNGYLIAELLSRYHPSLVDLQQYRRGSSMDSKLSNWSQLERAIAKMELDLPRPLIDALLHAQPQAHIDVLTRLYQQLTGKTLHTFSPPPQSASAVPSFLASTASTAVKARLHGSDVLGGLTDPLDTSGTVKAIQQTLQSFDDDRREERKRQSTRVRQHMAQQRLVYQALEKTSAATQPALLPPPVCSLKTVTVRQTATPLVASLPALQAQSKAPVTRTSLAALNAVVINSPHYAYRQTAPPYAEFALALPQLTDAAVAAVVDGVVMDALDSLTANAAASPKDFYSSLTLLFPLLAQCPLPSLSFQSALTLFTAWGQRLRQREPVLAAALAVDFLLPKLLPLVATQQEKLHALLPLLYAFSPVAAEARAGLVASLASLVALPTSLLLSVSALLQADVNPSTIAAALPYVEAYITADDPVLRALAMALLAPMAGEGAAVAVWRDWWPTVQAACAAPADTPDTADSRWCETASAVHVTCCLLASEAAEVDREAALAALETALRDTTMFPLIVSALPHLARVLGLLPPLRPLFFGLLDRVEGVKDYALASLPPPTLLPRVQALMGWFAVDLRAVWAPTVIVQAVLDHARAARLTPPLPPLLVEVAACTVADAAEPEFSAGFAALVPGLLTALLPSVGEQAGVVLATLSLLLASRVTRGHGLWALHPPATALRRGLTAVVEWMWGLVEEEEDGEEGQEEREGRAVVCEAMRRMAVGWKAVLSDDEWRGAGLEALTTRMEAFSAKPREAAEWEEKSSDPVQA